MNSYWWGAYNVLRDIYDNSVHKVTKNGSWYKYKVLGK